MKMMWLAVVAVMLASGLLAGCGSELAPPATVDISALIGGAAVDGEGFGEVERPGASPNEWVDPLRVPVEWPLTTVVIPPTRTRTPVPLELVKLEPLMRGVILNGLGASTLVLVDFVYDDGTRVRVEDPVGQEVTFTSENPLVASVDDIGAVFGVAGGRTEVRVESAEGLTAVVPVAVEVREVLPPLGPVGLLTTADVLAAEHGLGPLPPSSIDMMVFIGNTESGVVVNRLIVRLVKGADFAAVSSEHRLQVLAELPDDVLVVALPVAELSEMQAIVVKLAGDARVKGTHPVMVVGLH